MAKNNASVTVSLNMLLFFLLAVPFAAALPISFTIIAQGTQEVIITEQVIAENCTLNADTGIQSCVNQTVTSERLEQKPWTDEEKINDECNTSCEYDMPEFDVPEDVKISEYALL